MIGDFIFTSLPLDLLNYSKNISGEMNAMSYQTETETPTSSNIKLDPLFMSQSLPSSSNGHSGSLLSICSRSPTTRHRMSFFI